MEKVVTIFFLVFCFSYNLLASEKEESLPLERIFKVEKINFDSEKKNYRIVFRHQAGVYRSGKEFVPCLQKGLKEKREVKITANAMGLHLLSCKVQ